MGLSLPPYGVLLAAVILIVVGILAGLSLLKAPASLVAYILPLVMIGEAMALLMRLYWSWWVLLVMMICALCINIWNFYHHQDTGRSFFRIPIIALWMSYFLLPWVRAWFGVG